MELIGAGNVLQFALAGSVLLDLPDGAHWCNLSKDAVLGRANDLFLARPLPGTLAEWCERAIGLISELNGRRVTTTLAAGGGSIDEAALCAIRTGGDAVVGARWPDKRLRNFLAQTRPQFIPLALDDPRIAAINMHNADKVDFIQAARAVANICPLLMNLAQLPGAFRVSRADASVRLLQTLAAIAAHLGFPPLTEDQAKSLAARLPSPGDPGTASWEWAECQSPCKILCKARSALTRRGSTANRWLN